MPDDKTDQIVNTINAIADPDFRQAALKDLGDLNAAKAEEGIVVLRQFAAQHPETADALEGFIAEYRKSMAKIQKQSDELDVQWAELGPLRKPN
jgi:hypothetical protein